MLSNPVISSDMCNEMIQWFSERDDSVAIKVCGIVSNGGLRVAAVGGQLLERLAGHHHCAGTLPGGQLFGLLACLHHCADYYLLYQQLSLTEVYEQQQLARPRGKSDTQLCQKATGMVKFATGVVTCVQLGWTWGMLKLLSKASWTLRARSERVLKW